MTDPLTEALAKLILFEDSPVPQKSLRNPRVDALVDKYGEEKAFSLVNLARNNFAALSPEQRQDLTGLDLPIADREIEGGLQGASMIPMSVAYEYGLKPAAKYMPGINSLLPEAFRYQEGVTSPSSFSNVTAAARGAAAGGRIFPKETEDLLRLIMQGLSR